jgi:hypothetical protein
MASERVLHPLGKAKTLVRPAAGAMFRPRCDRVHLSSDVSEIKLVFSIPPERQRRIRAELECGAHRSLPVVRFDAKAGERSLDVMR